jgi:S1-C subfamily serine protease
VSRRQIVALCTAAAVFALAGVALSGDERWSDPSVVRVELARVTNAADVATGFVVAPGRVLTVAHVLDQSRRLVVRTGDRTLTGRLLRKDSQDDLALVAVNGLDPTAPTKLGRAATGGTPLRILVRRDGRRAVVAARLTRAIRATLRGPNSGPYARPALELRAHVALGDSGAPVVDDRDRVVGVLFARASSASPTAYAVDATALTPFLTAPVSLHLRK